MTDRHWLFWDGSCNFCRRLVAWVKRKDIDHRFEVLPYQMAPSPPMTPTLYAACEKAVHVVKADGGTLRGGRACLFVLGTLGWTSARILWRPPLVWAVDLGYWIVASNRRLFARLLSRHPRKRD
ncbi:MAG TPA: DCC1-like thiol-disulfide oxidoreductase family protein [Candidatus Binatia bacterium]|nr:DCC1-like thiol-disulfide oxidoreductase family protein [Candidatus Binatia bacterium]